MYANSAFELNTIRAALIKSALQCRTDVRGEWVAHFEMQLTDAKRELCRIVFTFAAICAHGPVLFKVLINPRSLFKATLCTAIASEVCPKFAMIQTRK